MIWLRRNALFFQVTIWTAVWVLLAAFVFRADRAAAVTSEFCGGVSGVWLALSGAVHKPQAVRRYEHRVKRLLARRREIQP